MEGFVSKWDPESNNGEIHACPENRFYALLGADNPGVAAQLNIIYPNGFNSNAKCPGPPDAVQVTFDPSPDGKTAQNVIIVSQPAATPVQMAQQAAFHAASASKHVNILNAMDGVQQTTLEAAHAAAANAHSAAASALASAAARHPLPSSVSEATLAAATAPRKAKGRR